MTEVLVPSARTINIEGPQTNFNTPEAKNVKEIVSQFICLKVNKPVKNIRKEVELMLKLSCEIESKHEIVMKNMCNRLSLTEENAHRNFVAVSEEIFETGINWGRIAVLCTFGAKLAEHSITNNWDNMIDKIIVWLSVAVLKRSSWIKEKGNGWNGFMEQFRDINSEGEQTWFNGLLAATVGLGAIAATIYIRS